VHSSPLLDITLLGLKTALGMHWCLFGRPLSCSLMSAGTASARLFLVGIASIKVSRRASKCATKAKPLTSRKLDTQLHSPGCPQWQTKQAPPKPRRLDYQNSQNVYCCFDWEPQHTKVLNLIPRVNRLPAFQATAS
jgi:hypothetical protein